MAEVNEQKNEGGNEVKRGGCCGGGGPGYSSPLIAMQKGEREKILYTICLYTGTGINEPDYLATIDVDPSSPTYSQIIHRLPVPNIGDELHHFGWNACSSCNEDSSKSRRYLVIPSLKSSNIYIVDTIDLKAPKLYKTISAEAIKTFNLSAPHTVHCLANGKIMISMLGDAHGEAPGGFLLLNENFDITGRWEADLDQDPDHSDHSDQLSSLLPKFNYDFWYQPGHNVMVSSEWGVPRHFYRGFDINDVAAGHYGRHLHFWDWNERKLKKSIDLGEEGLIPLEVRFHHDPTSTHGFVGAALSGNIFHWFKKETGKAAVEKLGEKEEGKGEEKEEKGEGEGEWVVEKVIDVPSIEYAGWPFPVPSLITDLLLSLDDRWLYFSNWLHGDIRQYDVSDPSNPKLTGQIFLGGLEGISSKFHGEINGRKVTGGPQMLQLSLDGSRLFVTNSLFSSWDNQFYPQFDQIGSYLLIVDCDQVNGGLKVNEKFFVDFGKEPLGPSRAHEMRYPGGDCTSDIWL